VRHRIAGGRRLRGFQEGRLDGCRYVDGDEAVGGEQGILTALVDDAQIAISVGVLVRDDDVDFVPL